MGVVLDELCRAMKRTASAAPALWLASVVTAPVEPSSAWAAPEPVAVAVTAWLRPPVNGACAA